MTARVFDLVVVGTSWGGLHALTILVSSLPAAFALPLVVVQHRGRQGDSLLASLLQDHTGLRVAEAEDKEPPAPGHVHLAPPDYHLLVELGYCSLTTDPAVRYSRPSIDVTFESAADTYGKGVIGIVLTGANDDGSAGLRRIADRGGLAIVQDPATATSAIMPEAARRAVPSARVLALEEIPAFLVALAPSSSASQPPASRRSVASRPEPRR